MCVKLQRLTIGIIWVTEPAERHILLNKTPKRYQLNSASQHFGGGFGNHKVDRYYVLGECRFEVKVSVLVILKNICLHEPVVGFDQTLAVGIPH